LAGIKQIGTRGGPLIMLDFLKIKGIIRGLKK